jgi:hypothetical protein
VEEGRRVELGNEWILDDLVRILMGYLIPIRRCLLFVVRSLDLDLEWALLASIHSNELEHSDMRTRQVVTSVCKTIEY